MRTGLVVLVAAIAGVGWSGCDPGDASDGGVDGPPSGDLGRDGDPIDAPADMGSGADAGDLGMDAPDSADLALDSSPDDLGVDASTPDLGSDLGVDADTTDLGIDGGPVDLGTDLGVDDAGTTDGGSAHGWPALPVTWDRTMDTGRRRGRQTRRMRRDLDCLSKKQEHGHLTAYGPYG